MLLSVLFLAILVAARLWIVQPFILGFIWIDMIVVATWSILPHLQKLLWGRRPFAVLMMTLLLVLLLIIPIAPLVSSTVGGSGPLIHAVITGDMTLPNLTWLNSIPLVGVKMYSAWHSLLDMGGSTIVTEVRPYIGTTTTWPVDQAARIGCFIVHCGLILPSSALLHWHGEQVALGIRHFTCRLTPKCDDVAILLATQAVHVVALGAVVTVLVQTMLGGTGLAVTGVPYATLLAVLMIPSYLVQPGPLPVLTPAAIRLYRAGDSIQDTVLSVWSGVVGTLDDVIRPMLIRMGVDLPLILILPGIIDGLITFGTVGLFIGPVILTVSQCLFSAWVNEAPAPDTNPDEILEEIAEIERNG